ncbi:MAG: hypothetical protein HGA67_01940 [Candidatus Yonathbacteria bacterium]|nr:hypothetical protein [Candidatus Yonathbacteria bacterium]
MLSRTSLFASIGISGIVLFALFTFVVLPAAVSAKGETLSSDTTTKETEAVVSVEADFPRIPEAPLPAIEIENARIDTQKESSLSLSFDLVSRDTLVQPDIRYAVQILTTSVDPTVESRMVSEQAYVERVVLAPGASVRKSIVYTVPAYLAGVYRVRVYAETTSGYRLASQDIDLVRFTKKTDDKAPYVRQMTCALASGSALAPAALAPITCTLERGMEDGVTIIPRTVTRAGTSFGETISDVKGSPVTAAPSAEFSFMTPSAAGHYMTVIAFADSDGNQITYPVVLTYGIGDAAISIQNVRYDKMSYAQGDVAQVSTFVRGILQNTQAEGGSLTVMVTDEKGSSCGESVSTLLGDIINRTNPVWDVSVPLTKECASPIISVSVTDSAGNVLANYTTGKPQESILMMILLIFGGIAFVGVLGFLFIRLRAKYPAVFPALLVAFVATGILGYPGVSAHAQATTTSAQPKAGVVLAQINISNAKVVSNTSGTLRVAFDIENQGAVSQPDIRYGIEILRTTSKGQELADMFIANENLTISAKQTVRKEVSYSVPGTLSGSYEVWVIAKNAGGITLGLSSAGKVTLSPSADTVKISLDSCHAVVGSDTKSYSLLQGVDVSNTEDLRLVCTAQNSSKKAVSVIPLFETHRRSIYGDLVSISYPTPTEIAFAANEKKEISIVIPKASEPQAYDVTVLFAKKDGNTPVSEKVLLHYVLQGKSATIQNVTLDKESYVKGDTVSVNVAFTPSADSFPNSRAGQGTGVSGLSVTFKMTDSKGDTCIAPVTKSVGSDQSSIVLSAPVTSGCVMPTASITIADGEGNILDSRSVQGAGTNPVDGASGQSFSMTDALMLLGFLVIVGLGFIGWNVFKRRTANQ